MIIELLVVAVMTYFLYKEIYCTNDNKKYGKPIKHLKVMDS